MTQQTQPIEPTREGEKPLAMAALDERFERLTIDLLEPSKTNPRTHFDEAYLAQLAESVREKGIVEPLLVRPFIVGKGSRAQTRYEIVAGECRYRASKRAGLKHLPCIIRDLTDEQALELQLVENIHRRDLTPLEEAAGFRALITSNPTKHSAASIAARIGKSASWVWDLMKLLELVPEAKQLLEQGRISVGHAVPIARLAAADQRKVIDPEGSGLWRGGSSEFDWDETDPANATRKPGKYDGLVARTVREVTDWINNHVRFDVTQAAKAAPLEFEAVAARVQEAEAKPGRGRKVIAITFEHFIPPDARDEDERTYGPKSFKFADGKEHVDVFPRRVYTAKPCEYAVLGVVAAGDRRGESFDVCIARDKCKVHWAEVIKAKQKNEKLRASGQASKADKREAAAEKRQQREAEERQRREQRWKVFKPALWQEVSAAAGKLSDKLPADVFAKVLSAHRLPKGTTPAGLAKVLLVDAIDSAFRTAWSTHDEPELRAWAKLLDVDPKGCEPANPQTSGVAKGKGKGKRNGKAAAA